MCGIGLRVDFGDSAERLFEALQAFDGDLRHRGPDASACLWGSATKAERVDRVARPRGDGLRRFALAFRHLYVIERSPRAVQPLGDPSGELWVALNGQIYNHVELRRALESSGHRFRTGSDAEVALAAYAQWGTECFRHFNGMWALALVDLRRGELVLCRDRLGIKGLYVASDPHGLLVGSEARAVARAASPGLGPDPTSVATFLAGFPPVDPERTFFRGVRALGAGTFATYSLREHAAPRISRFWSLPCDEEVGACPSFEEAKVDLARLFDDSVSLRLGADVPVGCLLSGGLDTSMVAATAARLREEGPPLKAFSIIYREPEMSEIPHIWAVMTHARLESHTHTLVPDEAFSLVDAVVSSVGRPLLGYELIAQYCAYRLARAEGSTVTLEGQGSDEIFAGMPSYATSFYRELLLSGRWLRLWNQLGSLARYERSTRARAGWASLVRPVIGARLDPSRRSRYEWLLTEPELPRRPPHDLTAHLRWLVERANLPTVLQAQDHMSMAHSVESRVPFLDHRLVELAFRLPSDYKVGEGRRKRILVEVARDRLPRSVVDRRDKKTFVSSSAWFPLRNYHESIRDTLSALPRGETVPVDWRRARLFAEAYFEGGHGDAYGVWRLHTLARWMATFD